MKIPKFLEFLFKKKETPKPIVASKTPVKQPVSSNAASSRYQRSNTHNDDIISDLTNPWNPLSPLYQANQDSYRQELPTINHHWDRNSYDDNHTTNSDYSSNDTTSYSNDSSSYDSSSSFDSGSSFD
jgi:hypothetical protein